MGSPSSSHNMFFVPINLQQIKQESMTDHEIDDASCKNSTELNKSMETELKVKEEIKDDPMTCKEWGNDHVNTNIDNSNNNETLLREDNVIHEERERELNSNVREEIKVELMSYKELDSTKIEISDLNDANNETFYNVDAHVEELNIEVLEEAGDEESAALKMAPKKAQRTKKPRYARKIVYPAQKGRKEPLRPIQESSSSIGAPSQSKKRKIIFSPSTGIVHGSESPVSPVFANIELLGFTPTSATSAMPGSGRSASSYENGVDVDIERDIDDLGDVNAGSDIDLDDDLIDTLRQRDVFEFPMEFEDSEDPGIAAAVQDMDAEADAALRASTLDDTLDDYLHFDWRGNLGNFEGVREEFVGPSGPTFDITGLTPLEIFKKIWDADIIAHIVRETNRYARQLQHNTIHKPNSRLSRWNDTTEDEIWRVLGVIMLQSLVVNNVEREHWYPKLEYLRVGAFKEIIPYNRFLLLKRCLHFVDNTLIPHTNNKLHKIMPIIEHLNKNFGSLYLPEQNVAIDESLLLWKGRLSFAQLIETKRARGGIKSYELCESRTGYLWRMKVYSGKGHVYAPQAMPQEADEGREVEDEPGSATSQIVFSLMRPLFGKGHTLVMDNFYNAPLLSRLLKSKYKTDTMGTLRLNREFVPETLKGKNKKNMALGEVYFSTTKDLSVVVWLDKSVVAMLSTFHDIKVSGKEKYGYYRYKPQVVLDYNLSMGGIDHKDQMLHAYPVERVGNMVWYKKLFRRLLNVSIHNAFVIFTHNNHEIGNRDFRLQLAQEILQVHRLQSVQTPRALAQTSAPSEMHLPAKNASKQRCKLCHAVKIRRSTMWRCGTCQVNLCLEGCYSAYHLNM